MPKSRMEMARLLVTGSRVVPNGARALTWNDVSFKTKAGFLSLF